MRLAPRVASGTRCICETPALHRLPEKKRRAILALRLAQELGGDGNTF
ncbi:hypothetical protein ACNKHR_03550 [Shigella flexneri]